MEISGSKAFHKFYSEGPPRNLRECGAEHIKQNLKNLFMTINRLLLCVAHINLIALVVCTLKLSTYEIKFVFHSGNHPQQVSEFMEFRFL